MATVSPMVNLEHRGPAPEATDGIYMSGCPTMSRWNLSRQYGALWAMSRLVLNQLTVEFAIVDLNSWPSMTTHGMERHRSRHRRDSAHVCTACRAGRKDMIVWTRQSGSALRLSPSTSASGWLELIAGVGVVVARSIAIDGRAQVAASQGRTPFDPIYCTPSILKYRVQLLFKVFFII
uniref:Uncharacterized protein n=1 Tax=Oryza glumipatula TaxID=40148 RepID=A0A0D9ZHH9_9ORYZ